MPDACNPWTTTASPSNLWRVQGITQRRITEASSSSASVLLRRTEQGEVRIVLRGDVNPWSTTTVPSLPPGGWAIVGNDVRRTEEECERITEAGDPRIVE